MIQGCRSDVVKSILICRYSRNLRVSPFKPQNMVAGLA
jgi:cobyric acid synthase